ncbi:MAG: hypothetical protein J7647_25040 [Cyanobacteria bacterium SBLK]|nr:hypothetical protein [Cyanobacteria bacterium SBLK]
MLREALGVGTLPATSYHRIAGDRMELDSTDSYSVILNPFGGVVRKFLSQSPNLGEFWVCNPDNSPYRNKKKETIFQADAV